MVTAAMKQKDACALEEKVQQTSTVHQKSETPPCWQKSVESNLWYFQYSCTDMRVGM